MKKFILLSVCHLFFSNFITASPSSLDTSFNHNGSTTNFFGSYTINQAQTVGVQLNGKIVNAGNSGDNAFIVQYNNDGTLDRTFNRTNTPGYIIINHGTQTAVYGIALQLDGKIIVSGYTNINQVDNAFIARYNRDGSVDISFNNGNPVITIFGSNSQLYGVALQSNGTIIVTGWATYLGFANALVARYTSSGTLDTTFNTTGYVTTLIGDVFTKGRAIAIQNDDKIVITGQAEINGVQQIIVMRYTTNGLLDSSSFNSFGPNPGSIYPLNNYLTSHAQGLVLQQDQKIIVVGSTNQDNLGFNNQSYTIVRINRDGTLDETFNSDDTPGYIISDVGLQANGAVIQSNTQIVTCGFNYANNHIVIIVRYNEDGTLDPTFNFAINNVGSNTIGNAIALQPDGKIIVSGTVGAHYTI